MTLTNKSRWYFILTLGHATASSQPPKPKINALFVKLIFYFYEAFTKPASIETIFVRVFFQVVESKYFTGSVYSLVFTTFGAKSKRKCRKAENNEPLLQYF